MSHSRAVCFDDKDFTCFECGKRCYNAQPVVSDGHEFCSEGCCNKWEKRDDAEFAARRKKDLDDAKEIFDDMKKRKTFSNRLIGAFCAGILGVFVGLFIGEKPGLISIATEVDQNRLLATCIIIGAIIGFIFPKAFIWVGKIITFFSAGKK